MRSTSILIILGIFFITLLASVIFWFTHKKGTQTVPVGNMQPLTLLHVANLAQPEQPTLLLPEAEVIGWSDFDAVLLGGNLLYNTTSDSLTFSLLGRTLGLDKERVFWSVGTHDIANPMLLKAVTKRPLFYGTRLNDIGIFVLDAETSVGKITDEQFDALKTFLAANNDVKSLIVLTGRLVWLYGDAQLSGNHISNSSVVPSNFNARISPLLKMWAKGDKQVLCIAGDIGNQINQFEYETEEGIHYLASGLHPTNSAKSRVLLLKQDATTRLLSWQFLNTSDLPN
jgi:hypothetical protein